ncbi:MAG: hypothetical protein ABI665_06395 [Vicinamibacterales bacterium]
MTPTAEVFTVSIALVCAAAPSAHAQMTHRLKGSLRTEAGAPVVSATVRAKALSGFRGEPFIGADELTVSTDAKGDWNMLGIQAGVWLFSTTAPDMLPAVLVIPVKMSQRQQVSAVGNSLTWPLPLFAAPAADHALLNVAADLLSAGKKEEAAQALTVALGPDTPAATRVVAGEMALLAQQASLARTLFEMVVKADPKNGRAQTGLASAALMIRDWEAAGKFLWIARDLAPKEQRPALAAAIGDLQQIARVQ